MCVCVLCIQVCVEVPVEATEGAGSSGTWWF